MYYFGLATSVGTVTPPTVTESGVHSLEIITFEMFNFSAPSTLSKSNFFIPFDEEMEHFCDYCY